MIFLRLITLALFATLVACGSSYDPSYRIPVDTELQKFSPPDREDLVDEEEEEEADDEDEGDEDIKGLDDSPKKKAPAKK
jgi:hypothetical protein